MQCENHFPPKESKSTSHTVCRDRRDGQREDSTDLTLSRHYVKGTGKASVRADSVLIQLPLGFSRAALHLPDGENTTVTLNTTGMQTS